MDGYGDGDESMDDFNYEHDNNNISRTNISNQHNISTASAANTSISNNNNRLSEKVENIARSIYNELEQNVKNYGEQSMRKVAKKSKFTKNVRILKKISIPFMTNSTYTHAHLLRKITFHTFLLPFAYPQPDPTVRISPRRL